MRSWCARHGGHPRGLEVYDVKIAGISLVITYRESFAAMVCEAGIDGLIRSVSEKNRQNARARAH